MKISKDTLERAISALKYRIDTANASPIIESDGVLPGLLREGRDNDQKAMQEIQTFINQPEY